MTALRIFRELFGTAAFVGVLMTAMAWWRAMADLRMQAEQQWSYRCGFVVGVAITFTVITAILALIWFIAHYEYRKRKALPQ